MPITWNCSCGKTLRVADNLAGRRVKCPVCESAVSVPQANPAFEVIEDVDSMPPPPPPSKPSTTRVRAEVTADDEPRKRRRVDDDDDDDRPRNKKRTDDEDEDEDERPRKKRRSDDEDEDDERPKGKKRRDDDEKPRKKKKQFKKGKTVNNNFRMEHGILNAGVLGGLAAMVGAVIWFVAGLLNDIIFFYPPVLFVLGLIAMIRGVMNRDNN
jgi:hypothetical protein